MIKEHEQIDCKSIAIMQPYLFPYLGYFQLAHSVDEFWLLDTVSFIQHGWMNRNKLLINGNTRWFTIPVNSGPHNQLICDKNFNNNAVYALSKLGKTLRFNYAKAPHVDHALNLVLMLRDTIASNPSPTDFTEAIESVLKHTFDLIGISTPIHRVSQLDLSDNLTGQGRIIEICRAVQAKRYINMVGGKDLYDASTFAANGIELQFLEAVLTPYEQGAKEEFYPGMSILDAVAWLAPRDILTLLDEYKIR